MFWTGVLATLFVEMAALIVAAIIRIDRRGKK
jgi:hypothetical protein